MDPVDWTRRQLGGERDALGSAVRVAAALRSVRGQSLGEARSLSEDSMERATREALDSEREVAEQGLEVEMEVAEGVEMEAAEGVEMEVAEKVEMEMEVVAVAGVVGVVKVLRGEGVRSNL